MLIETLSYIAWIKRASSYFTLYTMHVKDVFEMNMVFHLSSIVGFMVV